MSSVLGRITEEDVRKQVRRFWETFCNKQAAELGKYYGDGSVAFSVASLKPEPGRLSVARRAREYFQGESTLTVSTGPIDVVLLGNTAASATYTFRFYASQRAVGAEKKVEREIPSVRATQVFRVNPDGDLQILQEHFSVAIQK